jgi:hypothetical protein
MDDSIQSVVKDYNVNVIKMIDGTDVICQLLHTSVDTYTIEKPVIINREGGIMGFQQWCPYTSDAYFPIATHNVLTINPCELTIAYFYVQQVLTDKAIECMTEEEKQLIGEVHPHVVEGSSTLQ